MPPHAVQPYLGGSIEQRFIIDLVLYVVAVVAVAMVAVVVELSIICNTYI